jgi:hypothetical protein
MPWANAIIIASTVIIEGDNGEFLIYNGAAKANNLLFSIVAMATADPYGNQIPAGVTSYDAIAPGVGQNETFEGIYNAITNADGVNSQQGTWNIDGQFWNDATTFYTSVPISTNQPGQPFSTLETWHNMTLLNGWTVASGWTARYQFMPDGPDGSVWIGGIIVPGTITAGTDVWTFPPGYVPVTRQVVPLLSTGTAVSGAPAFLDINPTSGGALIRNGVAGVSYGFNDRYTLG